MAAGFTYLIYILKDHLGSWTTITDAEGNIEQKLSFDAWGNLRNPETWTGSSTEAPMFDRGYTGHEHITAFGLINMNGRCYDPVMSSFLSVDEYVQDPSSVQNFNRYSYCLNNPLKYTDPSGWKMRGASHSQDCDFNQYRRYMNTHLSEEQWANCGINRMVLAYIQMGVAMEMTMFMQGEEQKGGGSGVSNFTKGNDTYKVKYTYEGEGDARIYTVQKLYINGKETPLDKGGDWMKDFCKDIGIAYNEKEDSDFLNKITSSEIVSEGLSILSYQNMLISGAAKLVSQLGFKDGAELFGFVAKHSNRLGNIWGAATFVNDFANAYSANTIEEKCNYIMDGIADGVGFIPALKWFPVYWHLIGKHLHNTYMNEVIIPMIQNGENPGLPAYQPFK